MCTWVARQDRRMAFEIEAFQVAIGGALQPHRPTPLNTPRTAIRRDAVCSLYRPGGKRVHAMRNTPRGRDDVGAFG